MATSVEFWWRAWRVVQAVGMGVHRFDWALEQLEQAEQEARQRIFLNADTDLARAQREAFDARPFAERPVRVPTFALDVLMRNELDALVVAVRDLLRAQERLPKASRPHLVGQRELELLRNRLQHWEDGSGRSARALATDHPDFVPDLISANRGAIWIGGKKAGVLLASIWQWAGEMQTAIEDQLRALGEIVPDLGESSIHGDDALIWPPERIAYHWSMPLADEEAWLRSPSGTPFGSVEH